MAHRRSDLPHLIVPSQRVVTERYKARPVSFGRRNPPPKDPGAHGRRLQRRLSQIRLAAGRSGQRRRAIGIRDARGTVLEFEARAAGVSLAVQRLENRTTGIEILAVRVVDGTERAVVYVPEGAIEHFVGRLDEYLHVHTPKGNRKHRDLVESIGDIRIAVLQSYWTDPPDRLPLIGESAWWEVWLRRPDPSVDPLARFAKEAHLLGVRVKAQQAITFPERVVTLAFGTMEALSSCTELLCSVAELRRARETPAFFMDESAVDQVAWLDDLWARARRPPMDAPVVCVLDSGVDRAHPLLESILPEDAAQAYDLDWGTNDHWEGAGHGTPMAGLAAWGDLVEVLDGAQKVELTHTLESVKILPPDHHTEPELWGEVTREGIYRAEILSPTARRVNCLAVSSREPAPQGRPTSWSAAIDAVASGMDEDDGMRRLICVAAGNLGAGSFPDYPESNERAGLCEPAQAWNALTVGAFTDSVLVDDAGLAGWRPLSARGDLSPHSRTSMSWIHGRRWPLKPDLVLEGGNIARSPSGTNHTQPDQLCLLSSRRLGEERMGLLTPFAATSAATALCARMAAQVWAARPKLWPETVRALLVHSARWTAAMKDRYLAAGHRQRDYLRLLRCCGYGVPDLDRALNSTKSTVTLICQQTLQPYCREGGRTAMRDMHLHPLPWPVDALREMGGVTVQMRVTLSTFIEPSPGERGWNYKHRYASHGLRFRVKGPTESERSFRHRINEAARKEEHGSRERVEETGWQLGLNLQKLGSLHSDVWTGTAVDLADRGLIGVYPIVGWWRERAHLGRLERTARYALIVSIETPEEVLGEEVDVYGPIAAEVGVAVKV